MVLHIAPLLARFIDCSGLLVYRCDFVVILLSLILWSIAGITSKKSDVRHIVD